MRQQLVGEVDEKNQVAWILSPEQPAGSTQYAVASMMLVRKTIAQAL